MAKNPFKKKNVIDTATNVAIGGAANVAVDYAISSIDALATVKPMYLNIGKFVVGAAVSSMVADKMVKAAMDGVAVVGVSNLAKDLLFSEQGTAGVAQATMGRTHYINRRPNFARSMRTQKTSGIAQEVMG